MLILYKSNSGQRRKKMKFEFFVLYQYHFTTNKITHSKKNCTFSAEWVFTVFLVDLKKLSAA